MKHRANKGASPGQSPAKSTSSGKGTPGGGGRIGKGQQGGPTKASSSSTTTTTSSSSSSSASPVAPIDLKDIPLALPVLTVADHSQWVPRYHAVIRRSDSDGITLEDLDTVQLELEAMLAASVVRKMSLKEEIQVLSNAERYRGSGKNVGRKGPASPGKRGLNSASGSSSSSSNIRDSAKRFKSAFGKPVEPSSKIVGGVGGLPKLKSDQTNSSFDPLENEQIKPMIEQAKPTLPKNETPNRFWAFVEPYCASITGDDIKLLEDLTKSHTDMSEYFKIPSLGQHYTQRWAKEDLENERLKSAGEAMGVSSSGGNNSDESGGKMLKKVEIVDEVTPYGELTQRLVGGLMEENIMTSIEDSIEASNRRSCGSNDGGGGNNNDDMVKANLIKSLNINNPEALEARVRKELEEQGIINPDDDDDDVDNDEILEELKRCQNELRAVSSHNAQQLKRLLQSAKEETVRQELRSKLQRADNEVMDAYQKITLARSKKKPPSKKEREQAWKTLKEREVILKELESV